MASRLADRILLIGWDAADWQHITPLLDEGQLPGIEQLINRGVMGNLSTLSPILSPMLWNSIATGKTADKHGIFGFTQPKPDGKGQQPFSSHSRKVKAVWNMLSQSGLRCNVVGWWASHPAEAINGNVVTNLFNGIRKKPSGELQISPGTVHPHSRQEELGELKMHIDEVHPDDITPFIPRASELEPKDRRLYQVCKILTDCASIQAVTTMLLEKDDWDLTAVYFDAIDHFCHAFMHYHPPKMPTTKEDDFEIFKNVVRGAYLFHDMMLQRLTQLVGHDTTIILCSDHGFHSGGLRPRATPIEPAGPAAWHRQHGIIVMAGPGIRADERVYGANLIDITPTVLYMLGLPVGEDMDGRVIVDAFETPHAIETIESWESRPAVVDQPPIWAEQSDATQERDLMRQFMALGYIDDPGKDEQKAAEDCQRELDYNLARVFLSTSRAERALPLLVGLVNQAAWEDRYWKHLAQCCFELGYHQQTISVLNELYRDAVQPIFAKLLIAKSMIKLGRQSEAIELLHSISARQPRNPILLNIMAEAYLTLGLPDHSMELLGQALHVDPDYAQAHQTLSSLRLAQGDDNGAIEAGLEAIGLLYRLPRAHWNVGVALIRLQQYDRAEQVLQRLIKFEDNRFRIVAHRQLARLYRKKSLHDAAKKHALLARKQFQQARSENNSPSAWNDQWKLPTIPTVEDRKAQHLAQRRPKSQLTPREPSGKEFVIVSGLPRSGTSLMMQMLENGGLTPKTDRVRTADEDNPRGYYEWEAIKQLPRNPDLLDETGLENCSIKVISMLLPFLPRHHSYKVIFMNRPIDQVMASQQKMLKRAGSDSNGQSPDLPDGLRGQMDAHRKAVIKMVEKAENVEYLVIDYPDVVSNPATTAQALAKFLGPERVPNIKHSAAVVQDSLFRNR